MSVDDGLKCKELNPTDGEELGLHAPYLTHCAFCWTQVEHTRHPFWYIPTDLSCCICEKCYHDFRELFQWRELDGIWNGRRKHDMIELERFYPVHDRSFDTALAEIRRSCKFSH